MIMVVSPHAGLFYCLSFAIIDFIYKAFYVDKKQLIKDANNLLDRIEFILDSWVSQLKEKSDAT